jgi:hypothetical protein
LGGRGLGVWRFRSVGFFLECEELQIDGFFLGLLGVLNRWFCGFCFIKVKIMMLIVVGVVAE